MKFWMRLAAVLTVALCLAGCGGSRESKLVGTWKMRPPSAAVNALPGASSIMSGLSLEFRSDKTFTFTLGTPMEGTWSVDEDSGVVSTTTTKIAGQDVSKLPGAASLPLFKASYQLGENNSTLTLNSPGSNPSAGGTAGLTFEKS